MLPARVRGYASSWLDALLQEGEVRWIGSGDQCILFTRSDDLDLVRSEQEDAVAESESLGSGGCAELFPDPWGKYDLSTLMLRSTMPVHDLVDRLWRAVWGGTVANDSFQAVRRGVETEFTVPIPAAPAGQGRRPSRTAFGRWRGSLPLQGNWYRISWPDHEGDSIEREERQKDRVRILLDRYGVLFRELLGHELPQFRWSQLFRSLRIMELSGEVVSGCFFQGIVGLQFMSSAAFRSLACSMPDEVYWVNATDPASLCGVPVEGLSVPLPKRLPGTHLVYHGDRLVVVSQRHGAELSFYVPPDDASLARYLTVFTHLLTRPVQPRRRLVIESINGERAASSPYVSSFRAICDVAVEPGGVTLYRRF
jgi:ATP-dependent Lhr-like helicase